MSPYHHMHVNQLHRKDMQANKPVEKELLDMFNSIKVDKVKESVVDKNTLSSLLLYHNLDKEEPQYYRYLSRSLQKLKTPTVSEEEFLKILMNPDIDLSLSDKNQLADAFSILDSNKTGHLHVQDFMEAYIRSENYQQLPEKKKREAEDEIKKAFYSASENGDLTPMDFYHIVKFR